MFLLLTTLAVGQQRSQHNIGTFKKNLETTNVSKNGVASLNALTTTVSACDSYTWPQNGQTYTTSGTYTAPLGVNLVTTDQTVWDNSAITNGATVSFNNLSGYPASPPNPLNVVLGGVTASISASATSGLYSSDTFVGTNLPNESITINFSTPVYGFSSDIFATDISDNVISGNITVTYSDGTVDTRTVTNTTNNFGIFRVGLISSLVISLPATPVGYISFRNLRITSNPVETLNLTINTTPSSPTATSPQSFCSGTIANLIATGTNLLWYDAATGGNLLPSTTVLTNNTTYYVSQNNVASCESTRTSVLVLLNGVTVNILPTTLTYCSDAILPIQATATNTNNGFQNNYTPSNFTFSTVNTNGSIANGSLNTTNAPTSISLTSGNSGVGNFDGNTNYTTTFTNNSTVTFNWSYTTIDAAFYDYPRVIVNGGTPTIFSGYDINGTTNQSGAMTVSVLAGQTFALNMFTLDNLGGAATVTISNFNVVESPLTVATFNDFQNNYSPANFTFTTVNTNASVANGSVNTTNAPTSISLTGGNSGSGSGNTNYTTTFATASTVTFNWSYTTLDGDGAFYDNPTVIVNGGTPTALSGYNTSGATNQSGTMTVSVLAGQTFAFNMFTLDNFGGAATVTITNFKVEQPSSPSVSALWTASNGGTITGSTSTYSVIPATSGTYTLTVTNSSGCSASDSIEVIINPVTNSTTTAASCDTYTWSANGTTYTTSGTYTYVNGCDTQTLNLTITSSTSSTTIASACDTYTWSANATTYSTSGTYTYVNGCDTQTLNLTINTTPTAPTGNSTQTLTSGDTLASIVISPTSVIWYPTITDATNGTNALPNSTLALDNTTYYAVNSNGICSSNPLAVTITVLLKNVDFDNLNFSFYPNPTIGIVTINYSKEISQVSVINLLGQLISTKNTNSTEVQVDLSNLTAQTYLVKVVSEGNEKIIKIIKED